MLEPGTQWQARGLADAAQQEALEARRRGEWGAEQYAMGVRDVLRVLTGEEEPAGPLRTIYDRFSDSI